MAANVVRRNLKLNLAGLDFACLQEAHVSVVGGRADVLTAYVGCGPSSHSPAWCTGPWCCSK